LIGNRLEKRVRVECEEEEEEEGREEKKQ